MESTSLKETFSKGAGAVANKAVNYGNKWLNNKINYGINYARNFIRSYDFLGILPEQWTLLDYDGEKAFEFSAFMQASVKSESKVTQMPVEGGSFVAYNLVKTPLEINCVLAKQGFPPDLTAYVEALLTYVDSTDLLSIVTPDKEYKDMKLTKVSFDRSAENGVDIIYAECSFVEIKQVQSKYTSARVGGKRSRGRQQGKETSALQGFKNWIAG